LADPAEWCGDAPREPPRMAGAWLLEPRDLPDDARGVDPRVAPLDPRLRDAPLRTAPELFGREVAPLLTRPLVPPRVAGDVRWIPAAGREPDLIPAVPR